MTNFARLALAATLALAACSDGSNSSDQDPQLGTPDAAPGVDPADAAPTAQPDAAFALPDGGLPELACSLEEAQPIIECAVENCAGSLADQTALTACVAVQCGALLLTLSPDCATCALSALSGDPSAIADACASGVPGQ